MTRTLSRRLWFIAQIIGILLLSNLAATAAIGVYNWSVSVSSSVPPVATITYRLNCQGSVTIDILGDDGSPVHTLGPFTEAAGLHSREWDGSGATGGTGTYRARITAGRTQPGSAGTLTLLTGGSLSACIYGLTIDRFPESPGYGTIYLGNAAAGKLMAYNADGSPKDWSAGNHIGNALSLGLRSTGQSVPVGIGVDRLGNICVACSSGISNTGIKVFDHLGNELHHVFDTQAQGIFWLDAFAGPQGLEIYETETLTNSVRACTIGDTAWHTAIARVPGTTARQFCLEPGGDACYLATSDANAPNPGVSRYVRQPSGEWTKDADFDCGLSNFVIGPWTAVRYATGVSCDSLDPDGAGPYTATSLWMGLSAGNATFGGNVARMILNGSATTPTLFAGPISGGRIIAADSVGNVAMESAPSDGILWSQWGLYVPAGETTSDSRLTVPFTLAGSASAEILEKICDIRGMHNGVLVEFASAKLVTAALSGCFYIQESDRSCGLKVKCGAAVTHGTLVRVGGTLATECGERVLDDAQILGP